MPASNPTFPTQGAHKTLYKMLPTSYLSLLDKVSNTADMFHNYYSFISSNFSPLKNSTAQNVIMELEDENQ